MAAQNITIDDRSPQIRYTGDWETGGGPWEYLSTTHGTTTAGSQAIVTFSGESIAVFGTIASGTLGSSGAPVTTYSIDGGTPATFVGTSYFIDVYKQLFFQSPVLPTLPEHTLVITLDHTGGNELWFDYVQVAPVSVSTTSSSQSQSQTSASQTQSTGTPTATSTGTAGGLSRGAIAGFAVAGVAIVALLGIIVFLLLVLKRRKQAGNGRGQYEEAKCKFFMSILSSYPSPGCSVLFEIEPGPSGSITPFVPGSDLPPTDPSSSTPSTTNITPYANNTPDSSTYLQQHHHSLSTAHAYPSFNSNAGSSTAGSEVGGYASAYGGYASVSGSASVSGGGRTDADAPPAYRSPLRVANAQLDLGGGTYKGGR
ncbi:hypothetical protein Hypma_013091 [Hypsizygus marmoreus]|uniref:Uncharacterized protein n=1 Tax=Hypsizygus marmoreus TaxID=39966 RepID=A0A369JM45_HYPMA|nr:hypothetical protein Hypma_013091 [Hypsizygus marmoreus]